MGLLERVLKLHPEIGFCHIKGHSNPSKDSTKALRRFYLTLQEVLSSCHFAPGTPVVTPLFVPPGVPGTPLAGVPRICLRSCAFVVPAEHPQEYRAWKFLAGRASPPQPRRRQQPGQLSFVQSFHDLEDERCATTNVQNKLENSETTLPLRNLYLQHKQLHFTFKNN